MSARFSAQLLRPQLPGMSLPVIPIERGHVALEVLLQLAERAHRLIKCPRKNKDHTSTERPPECWPRGSRCPSPIAGNLTSRNVLAHAADPNRRESKKTSSLFLGFTKRLFLYPESSLGCQDTHSLSMTRHSTPFSSASILADLTSSLGTDLLC